MAFSNPLRWPIGWERTKKPISSNFDVTLSTSLDDLERLIKRLKPEDIMITTNQALRLDGGIRTGYDAIPEDTGIAMYFKRNGKEVCIPCDKFNSVQDNIRAIGLTLEYIKRMEHYGTSQMVDAVFTGFTALPASIILGAHTARIWYEVLEVTPTTPEHVVKAAYHALVRRYHPDNRDTGDLDKFNEVQKAYKEAMEAIS